MDVRKYKLVRYFTSQYRLSEHDKWRVWFYATLVAYDGKIEPYIKYISQNILQVLANLDLRKFDEKYIKLVLITYLVPQKVYKPRSEVEVEGGYVDLYLEKNMHFPYAHTNGYGS